jgi:protocatechuate 3,4-dioxygenase beta subunit
MWIYNKRRYSAEAVILLILSALAIAQEGTTATDPSVTITRSELAVPDDETPEAIVSGQVTDENGAPLAGVTVVARYQFYFTPGKKVSVQFETLTDARGGYRISLPGAGFQYSVGANKWGYTYTTKFFIARAEEAIDFSLKPRVYSGPQRKERFTYGIVTDSKTGETVAGAEVIQYSSGNRKRQVTTDASGRFTLSNGGGFYFYRFYAQRNGLVSSLSRSGGGKDQHIELTLDLPGTLAGRITTTNDGMPAADCVVAIAAMLKRPAFVWKTATDANGYYQLEDLPPGEYRYVINLPRSGKFENRYGLDQGTVRIEPGATTRGDFETEKRAHISGRILGPLNVPVGDATMHSFYSPIGDFVVEARGEFSALMPSRSIYLIKVFSLRHGYGEFQLPELKPGEVLENLAPSLNGVTRLRGTLSGPDGEPVADAKILNVTSDATGHFDTGFIPVPPDPHEFEIRLELPRPRNGTRLYMGGVLLPEEEPRERYYHNKTFRVPAAHGEDVWADIALERVPKRVLRGTTLDADGIPIPGAKVILYAGIPTTRQWLDDIAPHYSEMVQSGGPGERPASRVARTTSDEAGSWTINMVPEPDRTISGPQDEYHPNYLSILASDGQQQRTALAMKHIDVESPDPYEFPLVLRPTPPVLMMYAKVVDSEGNPLANVAWSVGTFHGPYTSDANGRVPIPRFWNRANLKLLADDNSIADVLAIESASAAPQPLAEEYAKISHVESENIFGAIQNEEEPPPHITFTDTYTSFDFIESNQPGVVITLEVRPSNAPDR